MVDEQLFSSLNEAENAGYKILTFAKTTRFEILNLENNTIELLKNYESENWGH